MVASMKNSHFLPSPTLPAKLRAQSCTCRTAHARGFGTSAQVDYGRCAVPPGSACSWSCMSIRRALEGGTEERLRQMSCCGLCTQRATQAATIGM
jgi:hypothetical protein